jgi:hypothetical protein
MRYTPEQYAEMVETVRSALQEAEHHNWRILKRMEDTDKPNLRAAHQALEEKLQTAMEALADLQDIRD